MVLIPTSYTLSLPRTPGQLSSLRHPIREVQWTPTRRTTSSTPTINLFTGKKLKDRNGDKGRGSKGVGESVRLGKSYPSTLSLPGDSVTGRIDRIGPSQTKVKGDTLRSTRLPEREQWFDTVEPTHHFSHFPLTKRRENYIIILYKKLEETTRGSVGVPMRNTKETRDTHVIPLHHHFLKINL